jgi:radical SAM superfamily enzyme YgiQ (UPF0313 family)
MTICLVTAPTATEFGELEEIRAQSVRRVGAEPALGILSLAAVLRERGERPAFVDLNQVYFDYADSPAFLAQDFAKVAAKRIAATIPDVCGFSSLCSSYPTTIRIAKALKTLRPQTTILLGGPQASVVDIRTLESFPFVDLILRGESERTLPLLLDELAGSGRVDRVPGLSYRTGSRPRRNALAPVIENLDTLPAPAYDLTGELRAADRASLELGRGCPFSCTFCSTNDFFRRKFRLRSPERVLRDMRSIAAEFPIRHFALVHDMFTVDRRRVVEFSEFMAASGEGFTWGCSARTDCIDEELLEIMARGGCCSIFLGVEVGSEKMQKVIDKGLDPRRAEELIDYAERLGIRTTVSLIAGFPEETWDDVRESMRVFMRSLRCAQSSPQLNLLAPLAETPLHGKYRDQLTLEELCSDMSNQSRSLNEQDLKLIRKYPEIFPNFYLLPTPNLNRNVLLELMEFVLVGAGRFRWLLSAIELVTNGMLDFFFEWHQFRVRTRPELTGSRLRSYYRVREFHLDFVAFVRAHEVAADDVVTSLLDLEDAMLRRSRQGEDLKPAGELLPPSSELRPNDVPLTRLKARIIELNCDIQRVVESIKQRIDPVWIRGPHFYLTRPFSNGLNRLYSVSRWVACVLRACDGRRTVEAILEHLAVEIPEVDPQVRDFVYVQLLQESQKLGYIDIYRRTKGRAKTRSVNGARARHKRLHKTEPKPRARAAKAG